MAVTSYNISILTLEDCPIRYDNSTTVLNILRCWRNHHSTSNTCLKCGQRLSFDLNFTLCCQHFYFTPVSTYIPQSIAIRTPHHYFVPKSLHIQLKKLHISSDQHFLIIPDPIYWQISSTLIYERVLKYVQTSDTKKTFHLYKEVQEAFLNHGSLSKRSEGKHTYFRKIALAKRSKLTIRAMIVPAPFLNPNQILIPQSMGEMFNIKDKWLILNRMPSLLPENFVALKVVGYWPHECFGIPNEILEQINGDYDGDELNGYLILNLQSQAECEAILNSECNIHSYTMGLKLNPCHDMLVVYYIRYDEIDFLPYKNRNLHETLKVIYDLYGSKVCFDSIVRLKNYYLEVMQKDLLFAITCQELEHMVDICENKTFEEFQQLCQGEQGCLATQIAANAKGTLYHLYQLVGSVGYQYAKNTTMTLGHTIQSSFWHGLNPVELVIHAQSGMDALICSSSISSVGYSYFKLINNLHSWQVNYKGELIDGSTVLEEDVLNILHSEDLLSKHSFQALISKYLTAN